MSNYRGIAVETNVRKFWEGRLVGKLRDYVNKELKGNQFGFRAGCGIESCRNEVLRFLIASRNANLPQMLVFLDFSKAYDSVDQVKLIKLLERKGILDPEEIRLLKWLLKNTVVRFGEAEVSVTTGVPQGSTLSPYLFNIYAE